jgi:fumarylpyruvate hydrolase
MSSHYVFPPTKPSTLRINGASALYPVRRIYCIGRNYLAHIREMGEADERDPPIFFQKPSDSIVEEGYGLIYPTATKDYQYECELVVALGWSSPTKDPLGIIKPEEALSYVYGYAVGFEMTRRDLQRAAAKAGHPWENGKSFDHSSPCSQIYTAEQIGHPSSGQLTLKVNGILKQSTNLSQLIWNVPEIISQLSKLYRLMPGDLIFTGTPDGVGPVLPGDELEGVIEGVGTLKMVITK